jgi:RNA polymerase sigma-70 factor (ECF subfamily)
VAFRAAYLLTRNAAEAEDACQDAFIKAHRALGHFRPGAPFRPWLLRIVTNEAKNRLRSASRRERLELQAARSTETMAPATEDIAISHEMGRRLLAALDRLPRRDREVVAYRYLLDLSVSETATALAMPPGTVKSRLARALRRLEAAFTDPTNIQGGR